LRHASSFQPDCVSPAARMSTAHARLFGGVYRG
jgi:hypothetical protein